MESLRIHINNELISLRNLTSSDFAALAWREEHGKRIGWKYAFGNGNERYKRILVQPGHGLAGIVVRIGRPVIIDATTADAGRVKEQDSIMLAENLQCAVAVPIIHLANIRGVLLAGSRRMRAYSQNEVLVMENAAEQLALLFR